MKSKLNLSPAKVKMARSLAADITRPIQRYVNLHTTVSVERAVLRALGADGVDRQGVPVPNLIVTQLGERNRHGAAAYYTNALLKTRTGTSGLNNAVAEGLDITGFPMAGKAALEKKAATLVKRFHKQVGGHVLKRKTLLARYRKKGKSPLLYLIVATGNVHEDVKQAEAAAEQGADIVAVIRSTAQSLLDHVPYGATTEGIGGTYATQENFRIMRRALDRVTSRKKRYIRLVNYASGLCMPEIAVMGAVERLDMMLNDSMYGVLFRDINMYRTFVDQHFSRLISAYADIVINTGEDNYLTTSDAFEKAHTVLASQFINEKFASNAGLPPRLMGLGHAFEMDPDKRNVVLYELAQARMTRELFPGRPLKYMPPTKFMTGDIFRGYVMNAMFNFVSAASGQSIHLLGMLTEAIQNPFMQDRCLAVENARYVMNAIADFSKEIEFKKDGLVMRRAKTVLDGAITFLSRIKKSGLFEAIEKGRFADVKRSKNGGKGLEGVLRKAEDYWNPVEELVREKGVGGR